jgi:glucan endo-1,3-alpha-glucosidase
MQWLSEVTTAQAAGIDGFALNISPSDSWTRTQLHRAYTAAESVAEFVMFLSFDMVAGAWTVQQIITLVNEFKTSPAQFCVNSLPFVSTFEGPDWSDNWCVVRNGTGGIFLVPDWSSIGPRGVGQRLAVLDGACR